MIKNFGSFIASAVSFVVYIVSRFVKVIALIVIGAIAIGVGAMFVAGHLGLPYLSMITPDPAISGYIGFYAGMIALAIIPLILLIKTTINIIWGYRSTWRFRQAMTGVWIVSFMIFLMTIVFTARNFVYETSLTELVSEDVINAEQPLRIDIDNSSSYDDTRIRFGPSYLSHGTFYNKEGIAVHFIPSTDDKLKISKTLISKGMNHRCAMRNMNYPSHKISYQDNRLSMDGYYELSNNDKFRAQRYRYEVSIPIGTVMSINESSDIFRHKELRYSDNIKDQLWVMTNDGLVNSQSSQPS